MDYKTDLNEKLKARFYRQGNIYFITCMNIMETVVKPPG